MLCTLVKADDRDLADGKRWTFEPKLDGLRLLCTYDGQRVRLESRNGHPQNLAFPEVADELRGRLARPAVLDAELVCLDEEGRSSFKRLQQRFHLRDTAVIRERTREFPVVLYVFDILSLAGHDLTGLPLRERRARLARAVRWNTRVRQVTALRGKAAALLAQACAHREEGIIAKDLESPYRGRRSGEWLKLKCEGRQELVIGGYTDPQRSRVGLGAVLVGYYETSPLGSKAKGPLIYAGKVGTGFTQATLRALRARLGKLARAQSPFAEGAPKGPGVHWVEPRLVAEITFAEWTQNDLLRQPRFEGLREDKRARQVVRELAAPITAQPPEKPRVGKTSKTKASQSLAVPPPSRGSVKTRAPAASARARKSREKSARPAWTHTDKILFPRAQITKRQMLEFYEAVAPSLLPILRDRPVTLERLPDGIAEGAPRFWQKNTPAYYPAWIPRLDIATEGGKPVAYAQVNELNTLLYLVNQGALTFHIGFSRLPDLAQPEFVLFDLDPGEAKFGAVMSIARELTGLLRDKGLETALKTSGKSGLHILTPWARRAGGYEEARAWAMEVAGELVRECGAIATTERAKAARAGKVYIDVIQNAAGHHAVPPYVLRATPEAGVSMPIRLEELNPRFRPARFNVQNAVDRLRSAEGRALDAQMRGILLGSAAPKTRKKAG